MLRSAVSAPSIARPFRSSAPSPVLTCTPTPGSDSTSGLQREDPRTVHPGVGSPSGDGAAPRPKPGLFNLRRKFNKKVPRSSLYTRFTDAQLQKWINPGYLHTASRLQFDTDLEKDIIAVAREAGLAPKTADAILAAVKEGDLPCNPGVLLSQVLRSTSTMEKYVSSSQSQRLLQQLPSLLNHCPEGMLNNLGVLHGFFPKPGQLPNMLLKYPKLLLASPFTVWSNLDKLSALLDIEVDELMALITKHPRLLNSAPSDLNLRFRSLEQLTQLSHGRLVKLLIRQPALLTYFHYTLEANIRNMSYALGVPLWRCMKLMVRQPSVAMLRPATLAAKVASLEALLGCGMERVSFMVMKQPSLLTLSSENLQRKFQLMAGVLGVTQEVATAMIVAMPALLTVTPELLQTKVACLKSVASLHPTWQRQLEDASPQSRALWVCFSAKRFDRFQSAHELGLKNLSMSKILKVSDVDWKRMAAEKSVDV